MKLEPTDRILHTYVIGARRFHVVAHTRDAHATIEVGWEASSNTGTHHAHQGEFARPYSDFATMYRELYSGGTFYACSEWAGQTLAEVGYTGGLNLEKEKERLSQVLQFMGFIQDDARVHALYDKLLELGWTFNAQSKPDNKRVLHEILGALSVVARHMPASPKPIERVTRVDLVAALKTLLDFQERCHVCVLPATRKLHDMGGRSGFYAYCDLHASNTSSELTMGNAIRGADRVLQRYYALEVAPETPADETQVGWEACNTFGCKTPKKKGSSMCADCLEDYKQDPEAYK